MLSEMKATLESTTDWGTINLKEKLAMNYMKDEVSGMNSDAGRVLGDLKVGAMSKLQESERKISFYRLLEIEKADESDLEAQKEQIRSSISQEKSSLLRYAVSSSI